MSRREIRLSAHLAWRDLRARYAQTILGPWWSMINLSVVLLGSSTAVALISGSSPKDQAPRIALGLAIWTLVSSVLVESSTLFETERGLLLNTSVSEIAIVFQLIIRNCIIFLHNLLVLFATFILSGMGLPIRLLLLVPVLCLISAALVLPSLLIARWSLLVVDLKVFLPSVVQFAFFLTPVLWSPPLTGRVALLTRFNPFSWPLEFSRQLLFENSWDALDLGCLVSVAVVGLTCVTILSNSSRSIRRYL